MLCMSDTAGSLEVEAYRLTLAQGEGASPEYGCMRPWPSAYDSAQDYQLGGDEGVKSLDSKHKPGELLPATVVLRYH